MSTVFVSSVLYWLRDCICKGGTLQIGIFSARACQPTICEMMELLMLLQYVVFQRKVLRAIFECQKTRYNFGKVGMKHRT